MTTLALVGPGRRRPRRPVADQPLPATEPGHRSSRPFDVFTLVVLSNQMVPFVVVGDLSLLRQTYYWGGGAVATVPGPIQYAIYAAIAGRSLVAIAHRPLEAGRVVARAVPLTLFVVVAAASVLWTPFPAVVTAKVGYFLVVNLVAVSLTLRYTTAEFLRLLALVLVVIVVSNLAFAVLRPDVAIVSYRIDTALRGYYEHKSGLGTALGLLAPVALRQVRPGLRKPLAAGAFVLLVAVQSALGIVAFVVGLGAPAAVGRLARIAPGPRRAPWISLVATLAAGTVVGWLIFDLLVGALGRDTTLSGRTLIWRTVAPVARDSLFLGHGYKGFFGVVEPLVYGPRLEPIPHPHNALLAAVVDLGMFGGFLGFALAVLVVRMWRLGTRPVVEHDEAALVGVGLSIATVAAVESSLVYGPGLLWVLFWACYLRAGGLRAGGLRAGGARTGGARTGGLRTRARSNGGGDQDKKRSERKRESWRYAERRSSHQTSPTVRRPDSDLSASIDLGWSYSCPSARSTDPSGSEPASTASPARSGSAPASTSRSGFW